jgi:hypothetical protein
MVSPSTCSIVPRAADMALLVLAFKLTRVMNIVGKPSLTTAIRPA